MGNLSKLFRWKRKVDIRDGLKVLETVWVRLVGDNDYQEARTAALKRSKQLRAKLRDSNSDEYIAAFTDIDAMTKEEIILGIVYSEIPDYRDEAVLVTPEKPLPELGDNPTLEEQEEYQTKLEEQRQERVDTLAKFIEKKSEERRGELGKLENLDELRRMYHNALINVKCTELFTGTFREFCVYRGTFKDSACKQPAFESFDEFDACAAQLKNQLIAAYTNLELTGEDLKN